MFDPIGDGLLSVANGKIIHEGDEVTITVAEGSYRGKIVPIGDESTDSHTLSDGTLKLFLLINDAHYPFFRYPRGPSGAKSIKKIIKH